MVGEIRRRNGNKKVAMVGHSQGTSQFFAGLGLIPDWYDENVTMTALLGPCTEPNQVYFAGAYTKENWKFLEDNDIYVFNGGEDWETKKALIYSDADKSLQDIVTMTGSLANNPIQACAAYAQTSLAGRFQQYTPDWFEEDNPKMPMMDFGLVKQTKVAMFVGLWDNTCPLPKA